MYTSEHLEAFAAAIKADYAMVSNSEFSIEFEHGKKYIRVVKTHANQRSVHSFIEISNGDVWKAASWKTPAKNSPRGNITNLTPRITSWTSAK